MKIIYLLPFAYFFETRLRGSSIAFHVIFEWGAAAVVVSLLGSAPPVQSLLLAALSYAAFISIYEIGYMANDLFSSQREHDGRRRGPQGASTPWLSAWFASRLLAFALATYAAGQWGHLAWWSFFGALAIVFSMHNTFSDRELKVVTFIWLAWFRFMAPIIFTVQTGERMGVALAAAIIYSSFRLLGYLDSKDMLHMPGRQRMHFRRFFFLMPLIAAVPLAQFDGARGFVLLSSYFAAAAVLATLFGLRKTLPTNSAGD